MFHNFSKTTLGRFRLVGVLEGFSYLILLCIAMPLKYLGGMPGAVKYFGWAHGVLFVIFCVLLVKVWIQYKWSFLKATVAFVSSLLPFGTFILDRRLQKEYPGE